MTTAHVKTTGAILWEIGGEWSVEEIEIGDPQAHEVVVELAASGLCHSYEHLVSGGTPIALPIIGGHEGAGIVTHPWADGPQGDHHCRRHPG